jgi:transposase
MGENVADIAGDGQTQDQVPTAGKPGRRGQPWHRRTVRQALVSAVPPPRKQYPRRPRPAIDPYIAVIDAILIADQQAPKKQRHTARRIWERLVAEHGAMCSEVTVSRYFAKRRIELSLHHIEVAVPQTHEPGAEAEVDFGEFWTRIGGMPVKCWMFVMRLSCSGRAFHVAFSTQGQEAFLQGHVLAFKHFGGIPARIRYDNLKPAVVKVLKGRNRAESDRFVALRSHYGFDSFFCRPGKDGAHEKGGVEGEIGRFRRRHLVPVPDVASLGALNRLVADADLLDDTRVITARPCTVAEAFAAELPTLQPLPMEAFDPALILHARVDLKARISVRQCHYSVSARYVGRRLTVRLTATAVEVFDAAQAVAHHERAAGRYVEVLALDHYLEVLRTKPGALPGATALAQAKACGSFTVTHQRYWDAVRRARGDACGTRALIEILLAHRTLPAIPLLSALTDALAAGVLDPQVILIEARRGAIDGDRSDSVVPMGVWGRCDRPAPTLAKYDALLT